MTYQALDIHFPYNLSVHESLQCIVTADTKANVCMHQNDMMILQTMGYIRTKICLGWF